MPVYRDIGGRTQPTREQLKNFIEGLVNRKLSKGPLSGEEIYKVSGPMMERFDPSFKNEPLRELALGNLRYNPTQTDIRLPIEEARIMPRQYPQDFSTMPATGVPAREVFRTPVGSADEVLPGTGMGFRQVVEKDIDSILDKEAMKIALGKHTDLNTLRRLDDARLNADWGKITEILNEVRARIPRTKVDEIKEGLMVYKQVNKGSKSEGLPYIERVYQRKLDAAKMLKASEGGVDEGGKLLKQGVVNSKLFDDFFSSRNSADWFITHVYPNWKKGKFIPKYAEIYNYLDSHKEEVAKIQDQITGMYVPVEKKTGGERLTPSAFREKFGRVIPASKEIIQRATEKEQAIKPKGKAKKAQHQGVLARAEALLRESKGLLPEGSAKGLEGELWELYVRESHANKIRPTYEGFQAWMNKERG